MNMEIDEKMPDVAKMPETQEPVGNGTKDPDLPPPEWALVELMGHRQRAGLCQEVTRFGSALLRIDIYDKAGEMVRSEHYGGAAIFSYTTCTEATAKEYGQRMRDWEKPAPYDALPPTEEPEFFDDNDEDDDEPF